MKAPESLRDRAAQLIFPRIGSNMPPSVDADADVERIEELLQRCPIGGLVLFRGRADTTPAALSRLQSAAPYPLLIASDLERGPGQQLRGASVFPHAMAFGHLGDRAPALVHHAAWLTAREALAAGVHWLFAPVADVRSNPDNPIIATRAFASDPVVVADLVQAFISGAREAGALTTAKHFPGHGDTETDSHAELPVVLRDRAALDALELAPFRAAIGAGVDSVMTAHVAYPALDPTGQAATFSAPILRKLLRDEFGFSGVVVSDSLLMGGVTEGGTEMSRRAPELVEAGVDVLLDVADPEAAVSALVEAVASGTLAASRIDEAFGRVWKMKTGLDARFGPDFWANPGSVSSTESSRVAADVAVGSMTEREGPGSDRLREQARSGRLIVVVRPHTDYPDPTQAPAEALFAEAHPGARIVSVGPDTHQDELDALVTDRTGVTVLALIVKPAAWRRFGLLDFQQRFVERMVEGAPTIVVALGSPRVLDPLAGAAFRLCTYSDVPVSVEAAARRVAALL